MWNLYALCLASLFHLRGSYGEGPEYQTKKCDIRIWHIDLMESVLTQTQNGGNLNIKQTKVMKKLDRLVERATEETAFMPCSLLKAYSSMILPDVDIPMPQESRDNQQRNPSLKNEILKENTASEKNQKTFDDNFPKGTRKMHEHLSIVQLEKDHSNTLEIKMSESSLESKDNDNTDKNEEAKAEYEVDLQPTDIAGAHEEGNTESTEEESNVEHNTDIEEINDSEEIPVYTVDHIPPGEDVGELQENDDGITHEGVDDNDSNEIPLYTGDRIPFVEDIEEMQKENIAEQIKSNVKSPDTDFMFQSHDESYSQEMPIYTADDIPLVEDIDRLQRNGAEEKSTAAVPNFPLQKALPINMSSHTAESEDHPDNDFKYQKEVNKHEEDDKIENKFRFFAETDKTWEDKCISAPNSETIMSENGSRCLLLKEECFPYCNDHHNSNPMSLCNKTKYLRDSAHPKKRLFTNKYSSHWCYNHHRRYRTSSKINCKYLNFGAQMCINKMKVHSCIMGPETKALDSKNNLAKSCMQRRDKRTKKSSLKCHYIIDIWDSISRSGSSKDIQSVINNDFQVGANKRSLTFDVKYLKSHENGIHTESTPFKITNGDNKNADDITKMPDTDDVKQVEPIGTSTHEAVHLNRNHSTVVTADNHKDEQSNSDEDLQSEQNIYTSESATSTNSTNDSEYGHSEFKRIIEIQQSQHNAKIQNLELMIVKLENKILLKSLEQSKDSYSVQNLENHILKIENELIKLNQTHQELKREHEALNSKQKKLSQMSVQANTSPERPNYPALDDKSGDELMTHQKKKIMELSKLVNNQSLDFHILQTKYKQLEEQNQQLFQTVMNQTALISLIMSQLNEMNENSMNDRIKMQELEIRLLNFQEQEARRRSQEDKFEKRPDQASKTVHYTKLPRPPANDPIDGSSALFTRIMLSLYPKRYLEAIQKIVKLQTRMGIYSPRLCLYHNVVVSNTVPFSSMSWTRCNSIEGTSAFKAVRDNAHSDNKYFKGEKNSTVADEHFAEEEYTRSNKAAEINAHDSGKAKESSAVKSNVNEKSNSNPIIFPIEDDEESNIEEVAFYRDNSDKHTGQHTQEELSKPLGRGWSANEDVVFFPIEDDEDENDNKGQDNRFETEDGNNEVTEDKQIHDDRWVSLQNVDVKDTVSKDRQNANGGRKETESDDMRIYEMDDKDKANANEEDQTDNMDDKNKSNEENLTDDVDNKNKLNEENQKDDDERKAMDDNEKVISKVDDIDKAIEDSKQTDDEKIDTDNITKKTSVQKINANDKPNKNSQQAEGAGEEVDNNEEKLETGDEKDNKSKESKQTGSIRNEGNAFKNSPNRNTGNISTYPGKEDIDSSSSETDEDSEDSKAREDGDEGHNFDGNNSEDTREDDPKHSESEQDNDSGNFVQDIGEIDYDDKTLSSFLDDINDDDVDKLNMKGIDQDNGDDYSIDNDDESKVSDKGESYGLDDRSSDYFPKNDEDNKWKFDQYDSNQENEEDSPGRNYDTPLETTSHANQDNKENSHRNKNDIPIKSKRQLTDGIGTVENHLSNGLNESENNQDNAIDEDKYKKNDKDIYNSNKDNTQGSNLRGGSESNSVSNPRKQTVGVNEANSPGDEAVPRGLPKDKQKHSQDSDDLNLEKQTTKDSILFEKYQAPQKSSQDNSQYPDEGKYLVESKNNDRDDLNKAQRAKDIHSDIANQKTLPPSSTVDSKQTVDMTKKSGENEKQKPSLSKDESQERAQELAKDKEKEKNMKKKLLLLEAKRLKEALQRPLLYTHEVSDLRPMDCHDLYKLNKVRNGLNRIFIHGLNSNVSVMCEVKNESAWTILLKRENGKVDFFRDFQAYKKGFGVLSAEHYIGNEKIHYLTNQKRYVLKVTLTNWEEETVFALYRHFWTDNEENGYQLHLQGFSGTAGDGLGKHSGMKFSTYDVDNDLLKTEMGGSCAKRFRGAGWYYKCYMSNLMGVYYTSAKIPTKQFDGITWKPWLGPNYSMKKVVMSVHPLEE